MWSTWEALTAAAPHRTLGFRSTGACRRSTGPSLAGAERRARRPQLPDIAGGGGARRAPAPLSRLVHSHNRTPSESTEGVLLAAWLS
jgi:hypothetical protein